MSKDIQNNKDACNNCSNLKEEDVFLDKYGVSNTFALEETKIKIREINLEKYGVENPMYSNEIKIKQQQTCMDKYGVDNASKSEEVKQKIVDTMQERFGVDNIMELEEYKLKIANTLSKNNSVATSKQQIYIHKLFGGVLNYSNDTPILDIAFPSEKIYLEYNGGGHNLKVKLGMITEKEFKNKELRRYHYLKDNGWKAIFIDSDKDLLPCDDILNIIFKMSREYLNTLNGNWIKFDIDNNSVIKDKNSYHFEFGRLRKIKEEDLKEVG
jgi:hypothetical protein